MDEAGAAASRARRQAGERFAWIEGWLHGLGMVQLDLGHLDRAEQHLREALEGRVQWLGAEHPDTLRTLDALARIAAQRGDRAAADGQREEAEQHWAEAESTWRGVLDAAARHAGAGHPLPPDLVSAARAWFASATRPRTAPRRA